MYKIYSTVKIRRGIWLVRRHLATTVTTGEFKRDELFHNAKPFSEVPEAKGLPLFGTLLDYTPLKGFRSEYVSQLWNKRHEELGPIYKERLPGDKHYTVFGNSKEDAETMFRSEGPFPIRFHLEGFQYVFTRARGIDSIANMTGEQWHKIRKVINPILLQNKTVWKYIHQQYLVSQDVGDHVMDNRDENGEVPNFDIILRKWAFEMAGTFILNTRLGALKSHPDPWIQETIVASNDVIQFLSDSIFGLKTWRYFETKQVKTVLKAVKRINEVIPIIIKSSDVNDGSEPSAMQKIMGDSSLTYLEKINVLADLLTGAIETTSQGAALFLYCAALYPDVQEKLRKEILELPKIEKLTGRDIGQMVYMNAFLKEAARLYPLLHAIMRACRHDTVLSGYRIPAGTFVNTTSNSTQNRNPDYFPEPDKFLPERWMDKERGSDDSNKFKSTGSFGYGARSCPGRRFAMQEIRLLFIALLPRFQIEYHHKPIVSVFRATAFPSEKPQFKFIPLEEQ